MKGLLVLTFINDKHQNNSHVLNEDKIDSYFRGNTSSFVKTCKNAALQEVQIHSSSVAAIQQQVEQFYEVYCVPDCGNVINNVLNQCGVYSSLFSGTEKLNVDMCGTNEDGTKCYQLYNNAECI